MLVVMLIIHTANIRHYFTGRTSRSRNFDCSTTLDCSASLRIVYPSQTLSKKAQPGPVRVCGHFYLSVPFLQDSIQYEMRVSVHNFLSVASMLTLPD